MNAAIYIRKSRKNNDKPSYRLTVQREQLPEYCRRQGWNSVIYDDGHASAARGKTEQLRLQETLDQIGNTMDEEPDWNACSITQEEYNNLSFEDQRQTIKSTIQTITMYNSYAILKYRFPRTKTGSYEARINLTRGNTSKPKPRKRTRRQLTNITDN